MSSSLAQEQPTSPSRPKAKPPRKTCSSGTMKRSAPPAPGQRGPSSGPKKPSDATTNNGSSPAPLTYPGTEPADDVNMNEVMGEEKVTLNVILESGQCSAVTVDSNIPMLDLLVHVAGRCKLSPAGHELQVRDEETGKPLDFKPNQTIGSLGVSSLHLLPKSRRPEWSQAAKAAGKAGQTFEITQRFTINLPGGQKAVMRVSPQLTLGQVLARVCQDKRLDTARYTLQHPAQPHTTLALTHTIADSKLSEINLVYADNSGKPGSAAQRPPPASQQASSMAAPAPPPPSAASSAPSSQDPGSWYMPAAGEPKKKKGFLSFLTKKEKKFKLDSHHNALETSSTTSHKSYQSSSSITAPRSTTPPPPTSLLRGGGPAPTPNARPHTMYVTSSSSPSPAGTPRGSSGSRSPARPEQRPSPSVDVRNTSSSPKDAPSSGRESEAKAAPPSRAGGGGKKRPAPPPPSRGKAAAAGVRGEEVEEVAVRASSVAPVAAAAPAVRAQEPTTSKAAEATTTTTAAAEKPSTSLNQAAAREATTTTVTTTTTNATSTSNSLLHSRNSSDSSGYHELTLSGADSPEAAHHPIPASFQTSIDTTSIDSSGGADNNHHHNGGDSGIQDMSSPEELEKKKKQEKEKKKEKEMQDGSRSSSGLDSGFSTLPTMSKLKKQKQGEEEKGGGPVDGGGGDGGYRTLPTSSKKKKKAPPPPPVVHQAKPAPLQEREEDRMPEPSVAQAVEVTSTPAEGKEDVQQEEGPPSPPPSPMEERRAPQSVVVSAAPPTTGGESDSAAAAASMKLNLDFLDDLESDSTDNDGGSSHRTLPETTATTTTAVETPPPPPPPTEPQDGIASGDQSARSATSSAYSESKDAFDLEDILNSVVFEEEPLRTSKPTTPRSMQDEDEAENDDDDVGSSTMVMMETASVVSEEVEVGELDDLRSRPCAFVAPPPPQEPPPEDYSPRGSHPLYVDKGTVVGEDNVSLTAASPLSREASRTEAEVCPYEAPVASPRSDDDNSHVTEQLPAETPLEEKPSLVQQDTPRRDSPQAEESSASQLPSAGDISHSAFAMTEEITAPVETVPPPLQFQTDKEEEEEEEVVTVTEEFIIPIAPGGSLDFSAAVKVSEDEEKRRSPHALTEPIINSRGESSSSSIINSRGESSSSSGLFDSGAKTDRMMTEFRQTDVRQKQSANTTPRQEDTAFTTTTTTTTSTSTKTQRTSLAAFITQSARSKEEENNDNRMKEEEEEEKEKRAREKEEEEERKEKRRREEQGKLLRQRETESMSTTRPVSKDFVSSAKKRENVTQETPAGVVSRGVQEEKAVGGAGKVKAASAKKEEFVLTLEDLSSVSLVPQRPKKVTRHVTSAPAPAPAPVPVKEQLHQEQQEKDAVSRDVSGSPERKHLHLAYVSDHGHVLPAPYSAPSSTFSAIHHNHHHHHHQPATGASKESSSPRATSPRREPEPVVKGKTTESESSYLARARLAMTPEPSPLPSLQQTSGVASSARSDSSSTSSERDFQPSSAGGGVGVGGSGSGGGDGGGGGSSDLHQQYGSLQEQFSMWQQQLQQNQSVLASQNSPGGGEGGVKSEEALKTLQMQMQMQQQMMEQMQRSMQALGLQQPPQLKQDSNTSAAAKDASPSSSSVPQPPSSSQVQVTVTPPTPAPLDPTVSSAKGMFRAQAPAQAKKTSASSSAQSKASRFQPKLDPREELMIAIRSFGGITGLNTVAVSDTRWTSGKQ